MNQFVYLINNRTGCKVKCVNPMFQSKLNSLIVQLEKLLVQLKNNGSSPSLDKQLKNVLNQVLVLLNGNSNQSKNTPRLPTNIKTKIKSLAKIIKFLNRIKDDSVHTRVLKIDLIILVIILIKILN